MGPPTRNLTSLPSHGCDTKAVDRAYATPDDKRCARQLQYDVAFLPSCYSICVDNNERVIEIEYRASP